MSQVYTINGINYTFPDEGDENWGEDVTNWAGAVTQGMLQKAGGLFTLTNEVDFGPTYGLKSLYLKSRATNPASSGIFRLGNDELISWRNAANNADLSVKVSSSNWLQFNGVNLADISTAQTFTNKTLTSPILTTPTLTGGTISGSAISGGTMTGTAISGGTITGATFTSSIFTNPSILTSITMNGLIYEVLATTTLTDATTGTVFTQVAASYNSIVVEYSLKRGAARHTGILLITHDGSTAQVSNMGPSIGTHGVTFSADISGANVRLRYTTTATGTAATMKYSLRKWNN